MSLAKKLKSIIKREPQPATFGKDPNEPWSVRAGITESEAGMLSAYLKSRGINPEFVSKDTKISHAKSAEFHKWKRDHLFDDPADTVSSVARERMKAQREEVEVLEAVDKEDTITFDIPLLIRMFEYAREDAKTDMDLHKVTEKLISIRDKGTLTMADYDFIVKLKESVDMDNLQEIFRDPTPLDHETVKKHLHNLMGIPHDENEPSATPTVHRAIKKVSTDSKSPMQKRSRQILQSLVQKHHIPIDAEHRALLNKEETVNEGGFKRIATDREETARLKKMSSLDKFRADAAAREKKHAEIEKKSGGMTAAIDRLEKHLNTEEADKNNVYDDKGKHIGTIHIGKYQAVAIHHPHGPTKEPHKDDDSITLNGEKDRQKGIDWIKGKHKELMGEEVEQIDELKKSTVKSWLGQQKVVPPKKPGMDKKAHNQRIKTRSKSWDRALDRMTGAKPTSEDVYQDSQAATQTPCDCGTTPNQTEPTYSRKKEMSKSARMIKALYKKHKMTEELYDHEKEDKSVATYGKKPKVQKLETFSDKEDQAAMVLKGGTTMTGQTRDTLEIDPVMRKANKNNDNKTNK